MVLDLRGKTYLAINRTGACIWPALVAGAERAELVASLVESFDVSQDQAVADLEAFLTELAAHDLLEPNKT